MISSKRAIKSMSALFLAMAFVFMGNALVVSSVGIILKEREVGEAAIGVISAFFFMGASVSTISAHRVIANLGHIRAFGVFGAIFSICILIHSLSENLALWTALRFALGYAYYGLLIIIESWLNAKAQNAVRSRVISFYEIVFYLSFGAGILLLGLNFTAHTLFIIAACFVLISSLPLNLLRINEPLHPTNAPISLPKVFAIAPLALVGSFIGGMLMNGFFSMASVFALAHGFTVREVSYFMAFGIFGGFLGQSVIGIFSDRFGRKKAIILCAFVALCGAVGLFFSNKNLILQCAFSMILGSGIFCLYGLSLARANDMLGDPTKRVELGRSMLFCYSIGSLLAPLMLGALMQGFGALGFEGFYMAILALFILFAFSPLVNKV